MVRHKHNRRTETMLSPTIPASLRPVAGIGRVDLWWVLSMPRVWMTRARQRRELRDLDARQLADAGIDPDYAWHEGRRAFWRA
jgi:uncharacterized protein YjiS (DUF1127 family)